MPKVIKPPVRDFPADAMVQVWGETVTKTKAAKMLNLSRSSIYKMVREGVLLENAAGYIIVRSVADWINAPKPQSTYLRIVR